MIDRPVGIVLFSPCQVISIVCVCHQGVRDLLKAVLDKIQTIPNTVSSAVVQQLLAAREVTLSLTHSCYPLGVVEYCVVIQEGFCNNMLLNVSCCINNMLRYGRCRFLTCRFSLRW